MKRLIALGSAALLAIAAMTGCSVKDDTNGSSGKGKKQITFLVFETPNLTPQYWDAAIKRVTDKYPDISVKKLVRRRRTAPRTPSSCSRRASSRT